MGDLDLWVLGEKNKMRNCSCSRSCLFPRFSPPKLEKGKKKKAVEGISLGLSMAGLFV